MLHGDCIELGRDGLPFAPFVAIVSALVDACGVGDVLELARPAAGELARLVPAPEPSGRTAAVTSSSQARLTMALTSLFETLSRRTPLLVVLEDLHWADVSTRELLPIVVRALRPARATVVITYRAEELPDDDPARRLFAEITRATGSVRIEQPVLRRRAVDGTVGGRHGARHPPGSAPQPRADTATGDRDALRVAAAAGRSLPCELDVDVLDDRLRPAFDHHVLVRDARRPGYTFRHALLGEAIAGTLLPREARRVHGRLAAACAFRCRRSRGAG